MLTIENNTVSGNAHYSVYIYQGYFTPTTFTGYENNTFIDVQGFGGGNFKTNITLNGRIQRLINSETIGESVTLPKVADFFYQKIKNF